MASFVGGPFVGIICVGTCPSTILTMFEPSVHLSGPMLKHELSAYVMASRHSPWRCIPGVTCHDLETTG